MSLITRRIFVKGLKVEAAIGIYDHEHHRTQPLIIDAIITIGTHQIHGLKDTLNYEIVGQTAHTIIAQGHIKLVETLAEDIASVLLNHPLAQDVEVTINKPQALQDADEAGCTVILTKG